MKCIQKIGGAIVLGVMAAGVLAATGTTNETYAAEQKPAVQKENTYSYTAHEGNTYVQMVRKAVQTYGIQHKKDIGNARIVAIETKAAAAADWPLLDEGQVVTFKQSQIKGWVDAAMKLSASDVAAWQVYVPYIDFNTNAIGR